MIYRAAASPLVRSSLLALALLSLVGMGGSFYAVFAAQTQASWKIALQVAAERYTSSLKDIETAYRGYLVAGTADFLSPYEEAKADLQRHAAALEEAAVKAGLAAELPNRMIAEGQALLQFADQAIAARGHSFDQAQALLITRAGKDLMDKVRVDLRSVEAWSQQQDDAIRRQTRWLYLPIAFISLLLLALVIGVFLHFAVRARRATWHARSLLADIMSRAPIGLALLDRHLHISQANQAFASMTADQGVAPRINAALSAVAPQIEEYLRLRLQRAISHRFHFHDEEAEQTLELTLNRQSRYAKADVFPVMLVREDGAQSPGVGLILTDMTQQHEAALELAAARDAADTANRAKSAFIANMSHELRTPLTAVLGYCELIEEDLRDLGQEAILADLNKINASARHLLELINDVLDLSKVEAQKMEVHPIEFTVGGLLEELEAATGSLITKNHNTLTLTAEAPDAVLATDDLKLKQILLNLLSNAAKFTSNGRITLHVAAIGPDDAEPPLPQTRFTVSDTGIGMSPEQRSSLFQRFSQADQTTTRKYGGTGLGLALTRALTLMLGGDITVESAEGQGSVFTVTIPTRYADAQAASAEAAASIASSATEAEPPDPARGTAPTVLVVDDDPAARELLTRHLQREGFVVITAVNGAEGLERLKASQPKPLAVLLDVMMPGIDGWHVLRTIREAPDTQDIPVIMQTVLNESNFAYALGATGYLKKPIRREVLAETLRTLAAPSAGHKVLIVDNDQDAGAELMEMLRLDGWNCRLAQDDAEALTALTEHQPDLALVNLTMPDMSGYAFIRQMRKNVHFANLPLVVMTAENASTNQVRDLAGDTAGIVRQGAMPLADLVSDLRQFAKSPPNPSNPPCDGT